MKESTLALESPWFTLVLYSPAGLDLKLAKRALEDSLKGLTPGLHSGAQATTLGRFSVPFLPALGPALQV